MKSLRNVVAFVKTVSEGSFSSAAIALDVSPAAVSKSVQNLERRLGVRLLNRSTRRLALTEEGEVFFKSCRSAMLELENAYGMMTESRREPAGVLRVTSAVSFGRRHMLPLLAAFTERYPKVTLDITLEDRFTDMILEGYDVSIRADIPPMGTMIAKRIVPVQAIVCGSPSYFERHPMPQRLEDLYQHNCIRFRSMGNRRILEWEFEKNGKILLQEVPGNLILNDSEGICQAAADGQGLAQMPGYLAMPLIGAGMLKPILLNYLSQSRAIYVSYLTRKYVAPRVSAFVDFMVEKLADNPELLIGSTARRREPYPTR